MNLIDLGWTEFFEKEFESFNGRGFKPLRIIREHKELYMLAGESGEYRGEITGKFRFEAKSRADFPAVGDWVVATPFENEAKAIIHAVLPRKSCFSRQAVLSGGQPETGGKTDEQVLASNIDTVLIVNGLDNDYSLRRMERYLSAAWDSGANPVIVLNKADICENIEAKIAEVEAITYDTPIHAMSAEKQSGLEQLDQYMVRGNTIVLLGSSGVGKSTIINQLLGEQRLKTQEIRQSDSKGRHTTTHRELVVLPEGGIVIDTPGMRLFKVWDGDEGLSHTFGDILELMSQCRFSDCKHRSEPGCAVKAALEEGILDQRRYDSYLKLQKEQNFLENRKNEAVFRKQQRDLGKYYKKILNEQNELRKKKLR